MVILNTNSFRTEYFTKPSSCQIDHTAGLLTIGSCFSDNIGQKFSENKFKVSVNPFGSVYNPISIFNLLWANELDRDKLVAVGGQYYHFDYHSQWTARDEDTLITLLTLKINSIKEKLKEASHLIITLGTSFAYELKESGHMVANCHKVPQKAFNKRLLKLDEMIKAFETLHGELLKINPELKLIFTVSPVRHIKDGIAENQLSKSLLRVLCNELSNSLNVEYFPAYELMMDDLRDYRFYKNDMIHPTEMAEDYIWDKFQQVYFPESTRKIIKEWNKITTALVHRPFNPGSDNHQKFLQTQLKNLAVFEEYFDVNEEKKMFEQQLL